MPSTDWMGDVGSKQQSQHREFPEQGGSASDLFLQSTSIFATNTWFALKWQESKTDFHLTLAVEAPNKHRIVLKSISPKQQAFHCKRNKMTYQAPCGTALTFLSVLSVQKQTTKVIKLYKMCTARYLRFSTPLETMPGFQITLKVPYTDGTSQVLFDKVPNTRGLSTKKSETMLAPPPRLIIFTVLTPKPFGKLVDMTHCIMSRYPVTRMLWGWVTHYKAVWSYVPRQAMTWCPSMFRTDEMDAISPVTVTTKGQDNFQKQIIAKQVKAQENKPALNSLVNSLSLRLPKQ